MPVCHKIETKAAKKKIKTLKHPNTCTKIHTHPDIYTH